MTKRYIEVIDACNKLCFSPNSTNFDEKYQANIVKLVGVVMNVLVKFASLQLFSGILNFQDHLFETMFAPGSRY